MKTDQDPLALAAALAAPFAAGVVRFKPGAVSGRRALAMPYIDARAVQDRLDAVLGSAHWQDDYEALPDGSVVCRLRIRLGEEWILKTDVGGPSAQPDAGDRLKAAFSDALKRAAVKFGVGRYLYQLPATWVDYDPEKRQLKNVPTLPAAVQPSGGRAPTVAERKALAALLATKGKTVDAMAKWLGLPEGAGLGELTREHYQAAVGHLQGS